LTQVPLLDLEAHHAPLREELRAALDEVLDSQKFILGPPVERLERAVESALGLAHAVGCASGTDALLLGLRALDVQPGDEVVTSPFTFFASAGAIHNVGARPVFADIEPRTFNLDPEAAEAAVGEGTKALMPVHLFGQMAEVERFRALADRRSLGMIEDAAQSIGARRRLPDGRTVTAGEVGEVGTLSFFPSKNLGGMGDGGMMVTQRDDLAARLRLLRVHGGRQMYHHEEVGYNSRLDSLQAAVLLVKLPHLERWSETRRRNAAHYDQAFAALEEITTPYVAPENVSIYNQYTVRVAGGRRDALREHLQRSGVGCSVYYPVPLHLQECFAHLGHAEGDFPESERAAREVLSLPVYPELTEEQREIVVRAVRSFFGA
jgi:dTDP-4-amino-4,6-dideoxygalactose transaminase